MLFRKLCKQPSLFKVVDMTLPDAYMDLKFDANVLTRFIVDRSCGCLLDIYLEYLCDDDTLMYIVDRSRNIKHLRIGHYIYISGEGLIEAVKKLPALEEVEIIICNDYSADDIEAIGHACPSLKAFSYNDVGSKTLAFTYNEEALAIAKSMHNLRNLQLIGSHLGKRCEQIKRLRRPYDSTADYSHQACADDPGHYGAYKLGSPYSEYDSDDSGFSGYPGYLDFEDEYLDYFDDYDDLPLHFFAQFAGAGLVDYDFSV
uniref:Uncharacterized protein n=1 Tax=Chenopodium quinoa TaxID=63459 RepID=A0A803LAY7_CHEQI